MKVFLTRHPALWRVTLAVLAIVGSAFMVLTVLDWPSLTQEGALARLARENGVKAAPLLAGELVECRILDGFGNDTGTDVWTLGFDGSRYQIAQLERCAMNLLCRPRYERDVARQYPPGSLQIITPSEDVPLQYRLVFARRGTPKTGEDTFGREVYDEYLALLFAPPSVVRVEAQQQRGVNNGTPDWTAPIDGVVAGTLLTEGVWQIRYTEHWNNDEMQHTRFVGYDAAGTPMEAIYAPTL